jgi:hypothetical protein
MPLPQSMLADNEPVGKESGAIGRTHQKNPL